MKKYIKNINHFMNYTLAKTSVFSLTEHINESFNNIDLSIGDIYSENDIYNYIQKIHRNENDFYEGDIGERIERFPKYIVAEIPINKICMDEYELDDDYMNDYIIMFKKHKQYPPIVLGYYDNNWGYNIIDGTHRANALKKCGLKSIICFVGLNKYQKSIL